MFLSITYSKIVNKLGTLPPNNIISEVILYTLDDWEKLIVYLKDTVIFIDNNLFENGIRPFVIGLKNWLFFGSPCGADVSASFNGLIETAKANGL